MNEDHNTYIETYFGHWAPLYDLQQVLTSRIREKTVQFIKAKPGALILDVATGTGRQAFEFAKKGYQVVGIDLLPEMLKVAIRRNKYPLVKFEVADATHIPYEADHFDVSVICVALHDMPRDIQETVLREMLRVTKPDGSIVIVDYRLPKHKIWGKIVYLFGRSYETKYYPQFMHQDLNQLLTSVGIQIQEEHIIMARAIRIIKGTKQEGK